MVAPGDGGAGVTGRVCFIACHWVNLSFLPVCAPRFPLLPLHAEEVCPPVSFFPLKKLQLQRQAVGGRVLWTPSLVSGDLLSSALADCGTRTATAELTGDTSCTDPSPRVPKLFQQLLHRLAPCLPPHPLGSAVSQHSPSGARWGQGWPCPVAPIRQMSSFACSWLLTSVLL